MFGRRSLLMALALVVVIAQGVAARAPVPVDLGQEDLPPGAVVRLGDVRLTHGATAECLAFSPDGKLLASTGQDAMLRVWDVGTGRERRRLDYSGDKFAQMVQQVAWSPDGKTLALSGQSMSIHFLDAETFKERQTLTGNGSKGASPVFAFAPDGKSVVYWTNDGVNRLYDLEAKKEIRNWPAGRGNVPRFAFAPDGKKLAVVTGAATVVLDVGTGNEIGSYKTDGFSPYSLVFAPDGKTLALGGFSEVRLWDPTAAKETVPVVGCQHKMPIQWLCYTADGKLLYSASADGEIKEWDVAVGKEKRAFALLSEKGTANPVSAMAFSADAKLLAWVAWGNRVRLTNLASGEELHPPTDRPLTGLLAFTPDGKQLVAPAADGNVRMWDATNGKLVRRFEGKVENVQFLGFGGDRKKLVAVGKEVVVWDVETGKEAKRLEGIQPRFGGMAALSPDGKLLAFGEVDVTSSPIARECKVQWWDLETGKEVAHSVGTHLGSVTAVAFAPSGKSLASIGGDQTVRVWEVSSGKQLASVELLKGFDLAYTADGKTLLSAVHFFDGGTSVVRVAQHEPDTAKERKGYDFTGQRFGAFTPDGSAVAWLAEGHMVRVADLASGKTLAELKGHQGMVRAVVFSADGKKMATGSADGTILIWDLTRFPLPNGGKE